MATVFVTTTARKTKWSPYALSNYDRVVRAARHDVAGNHQLNEEPARADIILFVEASSPFHFDILRSDLYRRFAKKCFVFDLQDRAIPLIPGIYMGIPKHLQTASIYCSGFYPRVFDNVMLEQIFPHTYCEFLFSFVGRAENCPQVREPVLRLSHPRAYLADSSSNQSDNDKQYVDVLQKSKFIICPKGLGPSTWRCFEAMRAGRVPVIVADSWLPPPGLDWAEFSVRVPESEIHTIPSVLERKEVVAEEMGNNAFKAWKSNFSLETSFNWLIERCLEIKPYVSTNERLIMRNRISEVATDELVRFLKDYVRNRLLRMDGPA